jgi:hypothetical protein
MPSPSRTAADRPGATDSCADLGAAALAVLGRNLGKASSNVDAGGYGQKKQSRAPMDRGW